MEVSILSEGESALYVPLMPKIRRPEQLLPNVFAKPPRQLHELIWYTVPTRKRDSLKRGIPTLVPGSFGIVGLNFAPMYNFNNYFRAGLSVDAQFDESANIRTIS